MSSRILAAYHRQQLAAQYAQHVAEAIQEANPDEQPTEPDREIMDFVMGNEHMARGVPILARGITGAIPGTSPHHHA